MPFNSFENYPMTWKPLINKHKKKIANQLVFQLENDIQNGVLKPGDKLPPQRELADYLDINLSTIARAFNSCEMKGLISGTIGSGTYVSKDVLITEPLLSQNATANYIDLGASHPISTCNSHIQNTMKNILQRTSIDNLFKYTDTLGKASHILSGNKWLNHFRLFPQENSLMISSGLQNSLTIALVSLLQAGDKIAVSSLIYPGFKNIANMLGLRLIAIPFRDNCMDADILEQQCRLENIKCIYIQPDFQNPTTYCMTTQERIEISDIVKKYDLICIEDGTYSFLNADIIFPLSHYIPDNHIYISTVSNALSVGLRTSYIYAASRYLPSLANGIRNINVMSSPFDAETVSALINSGIAFQIIEENIAELQKRNRLVNKIFDSHLLFGSVSSQFRWLEFDTNFFDFEKLALENGIKVFASERFIVGSSKVKPGIRISISTPETISELEAGLCILKKIIYG